MNNPLTIELVEKAIDFPVKHWEGNCYGIACDILRVGLAKGRPVHGHYLGEVHPDSLFGGRAVVRHGWIELEDGSILDPTRWVFESVKPYLYYTSDKTDYDEGGDQLRHDMAKPQPIYNPDEKQYDLPESPHREVIEILLSIDSTRKQIGISEALWLANTSYCYLDILAKPLYVILDGMGLSAFIPVDNYRRSMA